MKVNITTTRALTATLAALLAASPALATPAPLHVEAPANPDFLDPALALSRGAWQVLAATGGGLVAFRRVGGMAGADMVPDLAAAMPSASADGLTLTFTLRAGVRFGPPASRVVAASDVKASLERIFLLDSRGEDLYASILGARQMMAGTARTLSGVTANDSSRRVVVRLTRRDPGIVQALALPFAFVVPRTTPPLDQTANPPAGIGPYSIDTFEPDEDIVLARNPAYVAQSGLPAGVSDRITISIGKSVRAAAAHVARGGADYSSAAVAAVAVRRGGYAYGAVANAVPSAATTYAAVDATRPPFNDARVRRAAGLALDRPAAARAVPGGARPAWRMIPPNTPGHRDTRAAPDVAAARALVSAAGAGGKSVVVWSQPGAAAQAAVAVARALSRAGLAASVRRIPQNGALGRRIPRAGIATGVWSQIVPDGSDAYSSLIRGPQLGFPPDPPVPAISGDATLRSRARAANLIVPGPARAAAWARVDAAAVADGRVIPVATPVATEVTAKGVSGVAVHPVFGVLLQALTPPANRPAG